MDFPLNQGLLNVKTKFDFLRRQRKEKDNKMANCNMSMSIHTVNIIFKCIILYCMFYLYCTVPNPAVFLPISTTANRAI